MSLQKVRYPIRLNHRSDEFVPMAPLQNVPNLFQRPSPETLGTCFCGNCGILVKSIRFCEYCCAVNYCSRECADEDKQKHYLGGTCAIFHMLKEKAEKGEFGIPDSHTYLSVYNDPFYYKQVEAIRKQATQLQLTSEKMSEVLVQLYRFVGCSVCLLPPQYTPEFTLCNICHMSGHCSNHKQQFQQQHTEQMCHLSCVYGAYASTVFYKNQTPLVILPEDLIHSKQSMLQRGLISNGWMGWISHVLQKNSKSSGFTELQFKSMTKILELYYSDVCTLLYAANQLLYDQKGGLTERNSLTIHMVDFTGNLRYEDKIKSFEVLLHVIPNLQKLKLIIMEPPGSISTTEQYSSQIIRTCKKCRELGKKIELSYSNASIERWLQFRGMYYSARPDLCIWYSVEQLKFDKNCHNAISTYVSNVRDQHENNTPLVLTFGDSEQVDEIVEKLCENNSSQVVQLGGGEFVPQINPFACELPFADEKIMRGRDIGRNKYILCLKQC